MNKVFMTIFCSIWALSGPTLEGKTGRRIGLMANLAVWEGSSRVMGFTNTTKAKI